ncbi:hypothetical protein K3163_01770 [Qipengyuania sp. 1NDW9]|uniref:Tetracyclin repressor-like C-terminal domain-containing protein n=1 Tax=Qipengyuania xiapuensis TaxID=2867236 RepID=A0ABX8ZQR7_9SPHN|nr:MULTISPECIES: hypothetical protein [Qipengyuania]MBX7491931.1 hypothetical protein [Qipengyuania xiapuensis]MBY6127581.1 hypothetical protein [Qipengyuania aquimaris]QZD91367.1 hypothetical protein K3162_07210 [Qipengyuania xiapuensis]UOR15925.1 hypothetical protein LCM05_02480 [Qipengyuania aquimaris]
MSEDEIDQMRSRFAREAMALMERTGEEVTRMRLAAELKIARSRLDAVFPEESDLLDAITGEWFAPYIAIMDDVMGSELPPRRKMYEFVARRFVRLQQSFQEDPTSFRLYIEMGERYFEYAQSYIDLGDHYLCEIIAEAQAEGHLEGLDVDFARSVINQIVSTYLQPYSIAMLGDRLTEDKLAHIVDAIFDGLVAADGGAKSTKGLHAA